MDKSPVQCNLAVKISLGEDIRRVSVDPSASLTYNVLLATVKRLFKTLTEEEADGLTVRYQDDESDWITISSDEELVEAISLLKNVSSPNPVLRLSLTLKSHQQAGGCRAGKPWGKRHGCGGKRWHRARFFSLQKEGLTLLQAGDYKAARAMFEEQLSIFEHHTPIYNIACCEALAGNTSEALSYLQKSVNAGFTDAAHIENDSDLVSLRNEDGYKAILASLKSGNSTGQSSGACGQWKRWCGGRFRYFRLHKEAIQLMESGSPSNIQAARDLFLQQVSVFPHNTPLYNIACCDALLGNSKSALEFLQKAIDAGYSDVAHMESDTDLRSLRELQEFKAIVSALKSSNGSSSSSAVQIPVSCSIPVTPIPIISTATPAPTVAIPAPSVVIPVPTVAPAPDLRVPTVAPAPDLRAPANNDPEDANMKFLESMGFVDQKKNKEALRRANGNVSVAVSELLQQKNNFWY